METPITLICELDGARVGISAAASVRSELIQSLPSVPVDDGIRVPFSAEDVAAWQAFDASDACATVSSYLSALKVADFLQDDATASEAAKRANCLLQKCSQMQPDATTSLQSLQDHLVTRVLGVGGEPCMWLMKLPASLHPLVLLAAVVDNSLELKEFPLQVEHQLEPLLPGLPDQLESLSLGCKDRKVFFGKQLTDDLGRLAHLKTLELINVYPGNVPSFLRGLTRLRVDNSAAMAEPETSFPIMSLSDPTRIAPSGRCRLGALVALKELDVRYTFPAFDERDGVRAHAVTSLEVWHSPLPDAAAVEMLADHLAAFPSLSTLSINLVRRSENTPRSSADRPHCSRVLPHLEHLTALQLGGEFGKGLPHLCSRIPQLLQLSLNLYTFEPEMFDKLPQLQCLHLEGFDMVRIKVCYMIDSLPDCLTGLHLNGRLARDAVQDTLLPFRSHPNLKSLTFAGFALGSMAEHSVSQLTGLCNFSTYAPTPKGFDCFTRPGEQVQNLLTKIPASVTDLNIADARHIPLSAIPMLGALTTLQHLQLGRIHTSEVVLSLASHISSLVELRTFRAQWGDTSLPPYRAPDLTCSACEEMLCSLKDLPQLCLEDACPAALVALSQRTA